MFCPGGSNFRVKVYMIPLLYLRDKGKRNFIKNLSVLPLERKFFGNTRLDRSIIQIDPNTLEITYQLLSISINTNRMSTFFEK